MNGELALAIALVSHGNRALATNTSSRGSDLRSSNSTFKFVGEIRFTYPMGRESREIAGTPEEWFSWLFTQGIRRLKLLARGGVGPLPGPVAVSFAGGGDWRILALSQSSGQRWFSAWTIGDRQSPKPWRVAYGGEEARLDGSGAQRDIPEASRGLKNALYDAEILARVMDAPGWADTFQRAAKQLSNPDPHARFHDDALCAGYSLEARQLYAAAVDSWVFGGMGSWNDLWLDDPKLKRRYDHATLALFTAVLRSFEAVLDSWTA